MHNRTIILLLFLCMSYQSNGCMCLSSDTLKVRISQFLRIEEGVVFKGKVIYHGHDSTAMNARGTYPTVSIFNIESSWLGLDKKMTTIKIYDEHSSCDFTFNQDSTYLVYAYKSARTPYAPFFDTNLCTETKLYSQASEDLIILGNPIIHDILKKPIVSLKEYKKINLYNFVALPSLILNVILGFLFIRKRRKYLSNSN